MIFHTANELPKVVDFPRNSKLKPKEKIEDEILLHSSVGKFLDAHRIKVDVDRKKLNSNMATHASSLHTGKLCAVYSGSYIRIVHKNTNWKRPNPLDYIYTNSAPDHTVLSSTSNNEERPQKNETTITIYTIKIDGDEVNIHKEVKTKQTKHIYQDQYKIESDIIIWGEYSPQYNEMNLWVYLDGETETNIIGQIKESSYYKTRNVKPTISIGFEQEFLFKKAGKIIPATQVILDKISKEFTIPKELKSNLLNPRGGGRSILNQLFTNTKIGTDGRRILGEWRGTPKNLDITNQDSINSFISSSLKEIKELYTDLSKLFPGYHYLIGGGDEGEAIGTHINFGRAIYRTSFIVILNNILGKIIQDMHGGQRPRYLNPTDWFIPGRDNSERHENHYGIINNNSIGDSQVRRKTYPNGVEGFEYRPLPAIFLSERFTYLFLVYLMEILKLAHSKKITRRDTLETVIKKINIPEVWEFKYLVNNQTLKDCPHCRWNKRGGFIKRLHITYGCSESLVNNDLTQQITIKDGRKIKEWKFNFRYRDIPYMVADYIPKEKVSIKLEHSPQVKILAHKSKLPLLKEVNENVFNEKVEMELKELPENSFVIMGSKMSQESLLNLIKMCCLTIN